MNEIRKDREVVWVQILYLYLIPTLLLYFNVLPNNFRFILLFGIAILLYGIVRHNKWSSYDMGIKRNYLEDIGPYLIFTIAGVLFLIWLASIVPHTPFLNWWKNLKFLFLFIPIA
mgnify:CR=1 FL=1